MSEDEAVTRRPGGSENPVVTAFLVFSGEVSGISPVKLGAAR